MGQQRRQLIDRLRQLPGLHVYPGTANFLLVRLDRADLTAPALADRLLAEGLAIRTFDASQHLDERFFRVAVRTAAENQRLCEALAEVLTDSLGATAGLPSSVYGTGGQGTRGTHATRKTPALMLQGTSSNAGKSILTAALCRILFQDGVRVAPFKAQNMSLNSFVTRQGGEMGRAQVVQAQACRLEPDVRMNPILLKPNSDTGSQVIARRPAGGQHARGRVRAVQAPGVCRRARVLRLAGRGVRRHGARRGRLARRG